jgi:hypothetical protein
MTLLPELMAGSAHTIAPPTTHVPYENCVKRHHLINQTNDLDIYTLHITLK